MSPFPIIAPLASSTGIRLTGTPMRANIENAAAQLASIQAYLARFPRVDLVFPIMDTSVEARAVGCPSEFKDTVPVITAHPCADAAAVEALPIPDPQTTACMRVNIDVVQGILAAGRTVGAFCLGPVTLAAHLMGITALVRIAMKAPEDCARVLAHCTRIILPYARALIAAGARTLIVLEPQVNAFSPRIYEHSIRTALEDLASALPEPVLHVCGDTNPHLASFARTRHFSGLSLAAKVDFCAALDAHPALKEKTLIGNIDPVSVMLNGSPELVRAKVAALLDGMRGEKFILSSGCDLVPDTPLANVEMLIDTALQYRL